MAQVMPSIRVTDPHSRDATLERQDTGKLSTKGDGTLITGMHNRDDADTEDDRHPRERQAHGEAAKPHLSNLNERTGDTAEWERGI